MADRAMATNVILVDPDDREIGSGEKMAVHRQGVLHRAFSIFVFNVRKGLLLQRRARGKYHCSGLWSNTCCSHPAPGESTAAAAKRRLQEEMGFTCPLRTLFVFTYRADLENGLIEHEVDHVLVGDYDGHIAPNGAEVMGHRWLPVASLENRLDQQPETFTPWFKIALRQAALQRYILRYRTHA